MLETTIAGSLPKPAWLAEPEKLWAPWRLEGDDLWRGQEDAALVWLKEQEDAGIDIVGNGEQFRVHFVHGFLEKIEGIDWDRKTPMGIRADRYTVEVPTVTGPVPSAPIQYIAQLITCAPRSRIWPPPDSISQRNVAWQ